MTRVAENGSVLSTRRGKAVIGLLCAVALVDSIDAVIVNVALPSIQSRFSLSQQSLSWVSTGYLLTYSGVMLLGGRAADLLGRRRVLVTGIAVFALASLLGGFALTASLLIGARVVQGIGAALMMPAALSLVSVIYAGPDRQRAMNLWGGAVALATVAGVLLGGVLTQVVGWRAVLLVNPPICVVLLFAVFRLLPDDRRQARMATFDLPGAVLGTVGVMSLIWGVVEAPHAGWGSLDTIARLAFAALLLGAFLVNEHRRSQPLMPLSIWRTRGLAAANATQLIGIGGLYSMLFVVTLYMQTVLRYDPLQTGLAYLPATAAMLLGGFIATTAIPRMGTRWLIVGGSVVASVGVLLLSGVPVHGDYVRDLLPGLVVMALGLGAVLGSVMFAATAAVPADRSGLAASLVNNATQLGGAIFIAVLTTVATLHTTALLTAGASAPDALTSGYSLALMVSGIAVAVAALIGTRTHNTRSTEAV